MRVSHNTQMCAHVCVTVKALIFTIHFELLYKTKWDGSGSLGSHLAQSFCAMFVGCTLPSHAKFSGEMLRLQFTCISFSFVSDKTLEHVSLRSNAWKGVTAREQISTLKWIYQTNNLPQNFSLSIHSTIRWKQKMLVFIGCFGICFATLIK